MKVNKTDKVVQSILGVLMIFLAKLVVPMPTANRWRTKKGKTTNNQQYYGLANNPLPYKLSRSLSLSSLF